MVLVILPESFPATMLAVLEQMYHTPFVAWCKCTPLAPSSE